jgi:hypothetical protein
MVTPFTGVWFEIIYKPGKDHVVLNYVPKLDKEGTSHENTVEDIELSLYTIQED